jgi:antitoxin (DNA-binding transcriptional repressor) of toxin-antitoxin stability system
MKTLSMLEFRKGAKRALLAVQRGERILLTYRGRPIARLEPVRPTQAASADDSLLRIDDYAVDGRKSRLTNAQIDRALYGP